MQPGSILVTGAAGFVGRHLVPALQAAFPTAAVRTPRFDICDEDAVHQAVRAAAPDALVHLAAIAAPSEARRDPAAAWRVNLGGTLNLARALLALAPGCTMLFASSGDAYGASFRSGAKLDESAALAPLNPYAATKAAADLALGAMVPDGLRCLRLRPFNHTGPGQSEEYVVPAFARQIARIAAGLQDPVVEVGTLTPVRDFLDVRDVCGAYVAAVGRADELAPGTVLNVASGQPRRISEVLDGLLAASGIRAEIRTAPARLRPGDVPVATGDAAAAGRLLGWAPRIAWADTLADVLADWRMRVSPE